jgi:hypothetical protein
MVEAFGADELDDQARHPNLAVGPLDLADCPACPSNENKRACKETAHDPLLT